ncbi:MAG: GNAT family N-acetyltransferase [Anaerolineae bacterium]|nr:GNAT family N-acetyltransferase [Anaerolineae bacterium]
MTTVETNRFTIATLRDNPDLADAFWPQKQRIWMPYMFEDVYAGPRWRYLRDPYDDCQLYLVNEAGEPVAVAQTIPCVWDGTMDGLPVGWADSLVRAVDDYEAGREPNTLVALEIAIQPEYTGQGISYTMIRAVRTLAESKGFQAVIVAVRPSLKDRYPITPMERYVRWTRDDGTPFDPWLRVHWRVGGEILRVAHPSMVIDGSVDDWTSWTDMQFPESGDYIVPGALCPVQIDCAMNAGRYVEPNVWVHHPITTSRIGPG